MIRFLIILLAAAAFVIYFILTLVRGIIKTLQRSSSKSRRFDPPEAPPKPKENYKDVQDAKFIELSDEHKEG
jgi:hypothetical protein